MDEEKDCCENCGNYWDNKCHSEDNSQCLQNVTGAQVCAAYETRWQWQKKHWW